MSVHSIMPNCFGRQGTYFPKNGCRGCIWPSRKRRTAWSRLFVCEARGREEGTLAPGAIEGPERLLGARTRASLKNRATDGTRVEHFGRHHTANAALSAGRPGAGKFSEAARIFTMTDRAESATSRSCIGGRQLLCRLISQGFRGEKCGLGALH